MAKRRRSGRNINGVLPFDKPAGLTSNEALQKIKRLFRAQKAGHTGSLDPIATGCLPLCFGEATKLSAFLLNADKCYWVQATLGVRTDTGDAQGESLERRPVAVTERDIDGALEAFRGSIEQIPPMYSALKHQGRRLYELAREGREVERAPRPVHIYELTQEGSPESDDAGTTTAAFRVHCSKGTYIRTLIEDIGEALGCGAHVSALHRLSVGAFGASGLYDIDTLEAAAQVDREALEGFLLPADAALTNLPKVELSADTAFYVTQGHPVLVPRAPTEGLLRLYRADRRFLGVGEVLDDGRIAPKRLFATRAAH